MPTASRATGAATFRGEEVKRLREKKGWSREKLAVESDVSYPVIVRIEGGNHRGDIDTCRAVARALGTTMEALLQ